MIKRLINNIIRTVITVIILSVTTSHLGYSQSDLGSGPPSQLGGASGAAGPQGNDTTEVVKEKKPMASYLFSDSTRNQNIFSWNFNPYNNNITLINIDTMLNDFQKDYLFFQDQQTGVIYNGNLGGATIPLDYFNRVDNESFSFLDAYNAYLFTPSNVPFYNGKRPFTQLSFFMSGQTNKAEEQLRLIHSQNISPSTSINLTYRNNGTEGMYYSQKATDKNLSVALNHTGQRYTVHGGYIYNMGEIGENGGITDYFYTRDTIIGLTENIPTNLSYASNKFKQRTFYLTQSYGAPFQRVDSEDEEFNIRDKSAIFFGNTIEYTVAQNIYTDEYSSTESGYYPNWYINPEASRDSINEKNFDTRFFVQIQPYDRDGVLALLGGGIGYKFESYYYFQPNDYIYNSNNTTESSIYVYANAEGKLKKYLNWNGDFKYYPIGYRSQDIYANGQLHTTAYIKDRPISLSAEFHYKMETPSFWSEQYYSNHYAWNNSFPKEIETRIEGAIKIPSYGIELGGKQSITTNKVYFDANSLPALYDGTLSVTAAYLQKDFRIGGLNLKNRVLLQWSSSQKAAPVPLLSANANYYYEFNVVKDVLRMQIGVDGYYNTSYYGFGYNPAIMQFYNQQTVQTGDYVWLDAFVTGKWKRVRFIIKMQHLNYDLFGDRNYYQVAYYPLNRRMLKFGISWNFYD
ncbi:MAG: putative porin [Rikenellaceae bacterium]